MARRTSSGDGRRLRRVFGLMQAFEIVCVVDDHFDENPTGHLLARASCREVHVRRYEVAVPRMSSSARATEFILRGSAQLRFFDSCMFIGFRCWYEVDPHPDLPKCCRNRPSRMLISPACRDSIKFKIICIGRKSRYVQLLWPAIRVSL